MSALRNQLTDRHRSSRVPCRVCRQLNARHTVLQIVRSGITCQVRNDSNQKPKLAFVKSGLLHLGPYPNDTRWIPFPHDPIDALDHPIHSSTIDFDAPPGEDAFSQACPQYMKMMSDNDTSIMPWAQNRTVLFIGAFSKARRPVKLLLTHISSSRFVA